MRGHLDLYLALMFAPSGLSREQRELIGTAVSVANRCLYCIKHHSLALNHYWKNEKRVGEFISNYDSFELPEKERRMIDYSLKLTRSPAAVNEADIESLRGAGFTDEDIVNINTIAAYFNFVNRIASGLGVRFTPEEAAGYKY
jgi:uncharacterized peroxidase-related enzyme